jgi:hypothetical protein
MRKGFILTLTALATTFLVTSAVALGPVVVGVPDVYIGPKAAVGAPVAEPGTNTFRYSSALTLWGYVTPGVATGDGSDSDTLYQAWAVKDATLSGPTGSYLAAGTGVHYSIIQGNAVDALLLTPTVEVDGPGWAAEINNAFNAQGPALSDYSLSVAGALTFRNVRLSPLPEQANYPSPTKSDAGLPDGVWDAQEATLYVSDTSTTPGADKVLLVTVADTFGVPPTGVDFLSGGLVWNMVQDYTASTAGFVAYKFKTDGTTLDSTASDLVMTNSGTSLSILTPLTSTPSTSYWYYGQYDTLQATVDPLNLYRMKATVTAGVYTANPSMLLVFNARGNAGYGFVQTNSGTAGTDRGPGTAPSTLSAFLAPLEAGTPQAQFIVFDSSATQGGTPFVASAVKVENIALADVLASAEVVQATKTSFTVSSTGAATATQWGYYEAPFSTNGLPTFTRTPANGASGPLVMSAATVTNNIGMASFQGPTASIPTTIGKLVIIRARLSTTSSTSAKLPTIWLNTEAPTIQGGLFIERDNAGTSGPTSAQKDYYLVFEAKDSVCAFNLRVLADKASISGNVTLHELEVLEADMPLEP